jgi:hypothetical protein
VLLLNASDVMRQPVRSRIPAKQPWGFSAGPRLGEGRQDLPGLAASVVSAGAASSPAIEVGKRGARSR